MVETRYGIIGEMHSINPMMLEAAVAYFKKEEVNAIFITGNISGGKHPDLSSEDYLAVVLSILGRSQEEIFITGGQKDKVPQLEVVVQNISIRYPNIHSTARGNNLLELRNHSFIFIPGCEEKDKINQNGYFFQTERKTGFYQNGDCINNRFYLMNIKQAIQKIENPEQTIAICHTPMLFESNFLAPDHLKLGKVINTFDHPDTGETIREGKLISYVLTQKLLAIDPSLPITLMNYNRGSELLQKTLNSAGITKVISAKFGESIYHAVDSAGNPIVANNFNRELHWNATYFDGLKAGILRVKDNGTVAYSPVNLADRNVDRNS